MKRDLVWRESTIVFLYLDQQRAARDADNEVRKTTAHISSVVDTAPKALEVGLSLGVTGVAATMLTHADDSRARGRGCRSH